MKSPTITFSDEAVLEANKLKSLNSQYFGLGLRVYLAGKGCDGFEYGVCFDEKSETDKVFNHGELEVLCDKDSWKFLEGATVSWVNDERGSGFIVNNPNHRKFRGKFYQKQSWQEKFAQK